MVRKAMVCMVMAFMVLGIWVVTAVALDVPRISKEKAQINAWESGGGDY